MKINRLLFLFLLISCFASSQQKNLNCLDFSKGEFRNIDTNTGSISIIIRNGEKQLEISNGTESYKKVRWLDDCSYVLFFPSKEARKDKFKKFINENGGITVTMERTDGKTLYYKTSYNDGKQIITSEGRLVKLSNKASFN
ncbi:hypothetical protein [Apibacter sp. HY039]|uniref:hypothetical protein n=1 Tax=Apibacter sp. HY039 TaxID=2501476 RepID=UPI000FEC138A|nr:hypothetical protein [Apibacter sp. HY039]